jgi:hypothetical protein
LVERALEAEMAEHLGQGNNELVSNPNGNTQTARAIRLSRANSANCPSRFLATKTAVLSRKSCPSTRPGGRGSITRSCPCKPLV